MSQVPWHQRVGDGYVLGWVRVALGVLLFAQGLAAAQELAEFGYFGDTFHWPYLPEALVAPRKIYVTIVAMRVLLAALVIVGQRARTALFVSAVLGLYGILCNRLEFHHNRYALFLLSFLLSFAPADRSFLLLEGHMRPTERAEPFFAVRLAQLQVSLIYIASGASKLLDADWRDGVVLADRIQRHAHLAVAKGVPERVVAFLGSAGASSALAKLAITTELVVAVGLWSKRYRVVALWWGVWFHLITQITTQVESFGWLMLTAYGFFVTPDYEARKFCFDSSRTKSVIWAKIIAFLDWFGRFELRPWAGDDLENAHTIVIVRRDGSRATGLRAAEMITRCIPVFFPFWAIFAIVASFSKGSDGTSDG